MKQLSREDVLELAAQRQGPCVSIYQPVGAPGREALEGPIRYKNLLDRAEDTLVEGGMKRAEAHELMQPAWALHGIAEFHRAPGLGLALFAAPGFFRHFRLPSIFRSWRLWATGSISSRSSRCSPVTGGSTFWH